MGRGSSRIVLCALALAGCSASPPTVARSSGLELRGLAAAVGTASVTAPDDAAQAQAADALHDVANPDEGQDPADDGEELDDGLELAEPSPGTAARSPLTAMPDAEIEARLLKEPASLGSISIGSTNAGALMNGVQMPEDPRWAVVDPARAWGTRETIDALSRAIAEVHRQLPGSPKLYIGHISCEHGGRISPHRSHQAGRDVDISYFLDTNHRWYRRATATNLDRERTWAFVRALITETDVEMILIDGGVQRLLKDYALKTGEDKAWLDDVFQVGSRSRRALIRHARGHANHLHVRFFSPIAQESAQRVFPFLAKQGLFAQQVGAKPMVSFVQHVARKGQTLGSLARLYGTSVEAIQRANGMRTTLIHAKQVLNIPRAGSAPAPSTPSSPSLQRSVIVPARRLPPPKAAAVPMPEPRDDMGPASLGG